MGDSNVMGAIIDAIINPLLLLLFSVGAFLFVWGLVEFLWKVDTEDGQKTGKQHMLYGLLGMFIMATVFGIISIITSTLGVSFPPSLR